MGGVQVVCSFVCKALPLQRRVNVHFQPSQLQHEELLAGEAAPPPQPALLGQPEPLPCFQVGACQGRPPFCYLLQSPKTVSCYLLQSAQPNSSCCSQSAFFADCGSQEQRSLLAMGSKQSTVFAHCCSQPRQLILALSNR